MGVDGRKPPLPAPTESSVIDSAAGESQLGTELGTELGTDLHTDLSTRTDKTSYSIPEDGSPVTISTRRKREKNTLTSLSRDGNRSQTSLLIEYFEGSKTGADVQARPSVRVKVTPSSSRRTRDNDHIQITETKGEGRVPSYTRRISLASNKGDRHLAEAGDDKSLSSLASTTEGHSLTRAPPIEVEVMHKDQESSIASSDSPRYRRFVPPNPSEVSSMPPESFVETTRAVVSGSKTEEKPSVSRGLRAPPQRSRSVSRERLLAQKVMGKLESDRATESTRRHKRRSKSRSRSVSKEQLDTLKSPRRRSSKSHEEDTLHLSEDRSQATDSQISKRSVGNDSLRSGTSSASINNPKLLATVEDVIKRLVLPQITEIKQEQKSQRNRDRFESTSRRDSTASVESASREVGRRLSKTSSAPDVTPKGSSGQPESSSRSKTPKSRKSRKSDHRKLEESPSERAYSEDTATEDLILVSKKRSKRSGSKDATSTGAPLTTEALTHYDSKSSLSREKRRKKRSKSQSRSASLSESVDVSHRGIPMPISSDINSELTRDSILTERTERPHSAASQDRRTPTKHSASPAARGLSMTPVDVQRGLGTHHTNRSRDNVSLKSGKNSREMLKSQDASHSKGLETAIPAVVIGGAAAVGVATAASAGAKHRSARLDDSTGGVSPVQSVASYKDHELHPSHHDSLQHVHSEGSLSSLAQVSRRKPERHSTDSLSDRGNAREPVMEAYVVPGQKPDVLAKDINTRFWDEQHQVNNRNRDTFGSGVSDQTADYRRFTQSTDNSLGGNYLDKVAAGQHVQGLGANPEYRYTPVAAQSAVASLHEASVLETRSLGSDRSKLARQSFADSIEDGNQHKKHDIDVPPTQENSPTKRQINTSYSDQSTSQKSFVERMAHGESPMINQDRPLGLLDDDDPRMSASAIPLSHDPLPVFGAGALEDDSDIQTNPSIIQGVASREYTGLSKEFPIDQQKSFLDDQDRGESVSGTGHDAAARGLDAISGLPLHGDGDSKHLPRSSSRDLDYQPNLNRELSDPYVGGIGASPTPGYKHDEGYISAAPNALSPGAVTPDQFDNGPKLFDENDPDGVRGMGDFLGGDDPFVSKGHGRHLSGYSYGVPSPLYDSATGKGLDRIQSKDIVALMDHLTVRDAQRNARDTEILVTLVRSAAEMRNSFEDMKRLLNDSENNIITTNDKSTERIVQKHIQGPRPQPLGTPRIPRQASTEGGTIEDLPLKRRNVFTRALKGLRMRSTNDLTHIEEMLLQLLTEVETLKEAQGIGTKDPSINRGSEENLPAAQDGYEPEGFAGTSSATHSGYLSNSSSRQPVIARGGYDGRRVSEHRISTVPEGDEEQDAYEQSHHTQPQQDGDYDEFEGRLTPSNEVQRGVSMPLETPPKVPVSSMPLSNENTPRTDRSKKHKSGASSIFPKFSRWSETTASTVARFKGRKSKDEPQYEIPHSRSGSEIEFWAGPQRPSDKLHSTFSLEDQHNYENVMDDRPPSPLVPSEADEPQPHQAFRNSMNLEHPRPIPGPSDRFQHRLESQAQHYDSPVSPASDQWVSQSTLQRYSVGSNKRYSGGAGNLSPISDAGYSQTSSQGAPPPRPAKIPEDPLVPSRPSTRDNKPAYASPLSAEQLSPAMPGNVYAHVPTGYGGNGSPRSSSGQVPTRKPVGPRPPSSSFARDGANSPRRTRNRDTFGAGPHDDETF